MRLDIIGYDIDNLLKKIHLKRIKITNLNYIDRKHISFDIPDRDYKKVKRYISNHKVDIQHSMIKRLPSLIFNNLGLIIGVLVGLIFYGFSSHYLWKIEIFGNENIKNSEIISILNENGVKVGGKNDISTDEIEGILLNNYDRIAQVSVIKVGTTIIINLSEKLIYDDAEYKPILANNSGIIRSITVVTGTVNVKIGDYVNKGDVLVLPFNINADGEKVNVRPLAQIEAEIFVIGKAELKEKELELKRTDRQITTYEYEIFNIKFDGKNKNSFALFELVSYNENVSRLIPITRKKNVYYELIQVEVCYDLNEEKDRIAEESVNNARELLPIGDIIEESTSTQIINNTLYAYTTIKLLGTINDSI